MPSYTPTFTRTPILTSTPTPFPDCGTVSDYNISASFSASIVPGTADTGSHCDDCVTDVLIPFNFNIYGQLFSIVSASSNGNLQFVSTSNAFANSCFPVTSMNYAILAHWDDLETTNTSGCGTCGIFSSTSGSAPNRIFNIEWRTFLHSTPTSHVNFEVRLYEVPGKFEVIYGQIDNNASSATIGVQRSTGLSFTSWACNPVSGPQAGEKLTFFQDLCPTITPTRTNTGTPTNTRTPTPTASCGPNANYGIRQVTGGTPVPATFLVAGSRCDDCTASFPLPFSFSLYGTSFNSVAASSNGNLQFTGASNANTNTCLPAAALNNALMPYWTISSRT